VSCMTSRAMSPRSNQIDGAAVGGRGGPPEIVPSFVGATRRHELHGSDDASGAAAGHCAAHRRGPGAYTRPVFSSTLAALFTPPVSPCLRDLGEIMQPTYPTNCAYVEPISGRV
jgi:hypothetical protein